MAELSACFRGSLWKRDEGGRMVVTCVTGNDCHRSQMVGAWVPSAERQERSQNATAYQLRTCIQENPC